MKRKKYTERTLLPREDDYGLKRNVVKMHWVTKIHRQLNPDLARKLHKRYLDFLPDSVPQIDDNLYAQMFTKKLLYKYLNLMTIFKEGLLDLVDLGGKLEEDIKGENEVAAVKLADAIETSVINWFDKMLTWCDGNDSWALVDANRITAPTTIGGFMRHIKTAHRGDRPIEMTREQHRVEIEKLKGVDSVAEMLRREEDGRGS